MSTSNFGRRDFGWPDKDPGYKTPELIEQARARFYERLDMPQSPLVDVDDLPERHWLWTGSVRPDGYAYFCASGALLMIRKYSWRLHVGDIPEGWFVQQYCGQPLCVAPNHLSLELRRSRSQKLSLRNRQDIHAMYHGSDYSSRTSVKRLADIFGVSEAHIYRIIRAGNTGR